MAVDGSLCAVGTMTLPLLAPPVIVDGGSCGRSPRSTFAPTSRKKDNHWNSNRNSVWKLRLMTTSRCLPIDGGYLDDEMRRDLRKIIEHSVKNRTINVVEI